MPVISTPGRMKKEEPEFGGQPGLHSDTTSLNNRYNASKTSMAKDGLGLSTQLQPWGQATLQAAKDDPTPVCEHQVFEVSPAPDTPADKANSRLVIAKSFLFYLAFPSSAERPHFVYLLILLSSAKCIR